MLNIGWGEIMVILLVALVVVGPAKLPEIARNLGKGLRELRRFTQSAEQQVKETFNIDVNQIKNDFNPFSSVMSPTTPTSSPATPANQRPPLAIEPPRPVDLGPEAPKPAAETVAPDLAGGAVAPSVDLGPPAD